MLSLTPKIDPTIQSLLDDRDFLAELLDALGSPLGLILPQRVAENVAAFREIYRRHRLAGRLFYAHKANRSSALLRELAAGDSGVDVASLGELQHALGAGFTPDRIVATGPKNREFLWLAARTGVTVSVDSHDELAELAGIVAGHRLPRVPVSLRLSGFASSGVRVLTRRSRFGTPAGRLPELLDLLEKRADHVELTGVAYHLDTIGLPEKAVAVEGCLAALDECRARGLRPRSLDIGGGFGVNYLADGAEWERWTSELGQAVLGRRPPLTWHGHGYGLRAEGGTLRGSLGVYPAYRPTAGAGYLDRLLGTPAPDQGRPLGELLLDHMYDLDIEPGRALLDQCGLVLARVLSVTTGDDGIRVGLDCNARDVSLEEHGVLMDPVVIPRTGQRRAGPAGVYLFGNLCLEADLITRRQVFLPVVPRPGDLLAFVNTAGYFMDFSATEALHQPVARKVAVYRSAGLRRWCLDEQYWPVHPRQEVP
ncbi:Y4yA family PLP-dependent enzyme [Actinoplanes teichomyceticus]|uniref:Diaminopimelate decarboxylase n=1 Tax=Actinoplanes teichomyceticus TaxID=1867 RepID=A0A561WB08_ACTTI|nr:Y4yA family PLP-dependent enzyme [Actinoplanes teichomyceticus]TWG21042.1 diaminopimelate decarboxylase [Actinoplanes teichomyceticus]GIF14862.1 diaminopimelate decarboxylase [Actinoplanes teichomyceticus]